MDAEDQRRQRRPPLGGNSSRTAIRPRSSPAQRIGGVQPIAGGGQPRGAPLYGRVPRAAGSAGLRPASASQLGRYRQRDLGLSQAHRVNKQLAAAAIGLTTSEAADLPVPEEFDEDGEPIKWRPHSASLASDRRPWGSASASSLNPAPRSKPWSRQEQVEQVRRAQASLASRSVAVE